MRIQLIAFAAFACLIVGCTDSERPGVTKISGSYIRLMGADPEPLGHAAERVFGAMNLLSIQSGPSGSGWTVTGRNFQDTRLTVSITPAGAGASQVAVNIEPGESEGLSLRVLDQIQEQLHN